MLCFDDYTVSSDKLPHPRLAVLKNGLLFLILVEEEKSKKGEEAICQMKRRLSQINQGIRILL